MLQEYELSTNTPVNLLLKGLPRKDRELITKRLVQVDLQFGDILCGHDQPYQHVYFPLSGFISLMVVVDNHPPLEVGLIGKEGMLGVTLTLGVNNSPQHAVVQGPGTALRMTSNQFLRALRESPALLAQLSQLAACTHFHEVDARLARWLLMTHDRADTDSFHLTHQYLADMLGVQRSAVTIAAGILQKRKLISYSRGEITVLKRKGLEAVSCECYDAVIQDYAQVFS